MGALLDDPEALAVLEKWIPGLVNAGEADKRRDQPLTALRNVAPDVMTDKMLKDIDADLAKLPARK